MQTPLGADLLSPVISLVLLVWEIGGGAPSPATVGPACRQIGGGQRALCLLLNCFPLKVILMQKERILGWHTLIPFGNNINSSNRLY